MLVNSDFITGTHSIAINGVDLGVTLNGARLSWSTDDEPVTVDLYGATVIDRIFRGVSVMTLAFDVLQLTAAIRIAALRYFSAGIGEVLESGTLLGAQNAHSSLIMTAITGPAKAKVGFIKYGFFVFPLGDVEQVFNSQQLQAYNLTFQVFPVLFEGVPPIGMSGSAPTDPHKARWFFVE